MKIDFHRAFWKQFIKLKVKGASLHINLMEVSVPLGLVCLPEESQLACWDDPGGGAG
jgi:hypothetical protein